MSVSRREFFKAGSGLGAGALLFPKFGDAAEGKFVEARGEELFTPNGKKLLLRGINLGNWFEPEGYMFLFEGGPQSPREIESFFSELIGPVAAADFWKTYRKNYITEADIQLIAESGLNSVRIPLHYKFFEQGREGFAALDPAIAWCKRAGLWVILDLHCAPGGQTGTNIDDSYGYPWLYEGEQDQARTCAIWKAIARHFRDEPAVLGYDLLNEPIPHFPQLQQYNNKLEPLYRRITASIREVDKNHLVILGGAQWDSNFKVFGPPFDPKLVYQLHKYWMPPTQASIQEYVDFRERYHVPAWLGESGENTDEWIKQLNGLLEKNDIGWCFWPYKKMEKISSMVSIAKPPYWDEITAFAKMPTGTGNAEKRIAARPSLDHSRAALDGLLENIRVERCRKNRGYFDALGLKAGS